MAVVVPCFNEGRRLDVEAFGAGVRDHPSLRLLFVDDGSTDETPRVLAQLVARAPDRLSALTLPSNQGKAEAVRRGLLAAVAGSPDLVGYLDADLATPIAELARLSEVFADPAVLGALGSRVALLGRDIQRSAWRHYVGRVFATLASLTLGLRVYDTQCGAKLFRNVEPVRRVFEQPFLTSWAFDVEILARLRRLERAGDIPPVATVVREVALRRWTDVRGSKIGLVDSVVATLQLGLVWWTYRR